MMGSGVLIKPVKWQARRVARSAVQGTRRANGTDLTGHRAPLGARRINGLGQPAGSDARSGGGFFPGAAWLPGPDQDETAPRLESQQAVHLTRHSCPGHNLTINIGARHPDFYHGLLARAATTLPLGAASSCGPKARDLTRFRRYLRQWRRTLPSEPSMACHPHHSAWTAPRFATTTRKPDTRGSGWHETWWPPARDSPPSKSPDGWTSAQMPAYYARAELAGNGAVARFYGEE